MRRPVMLLLLLGSMSSFAAKVELSDTGSGTRYCKQKNPRCTLDFSTKSKARDAAKSNARDKAEYQCSSKGGKILNSKNLNSRCTKITAWIDYYSCSASHRVSCETSPNGNISVDDKKLKKCNASLGAASLAYNRKDPVGTKQMNSACIYAVSQNNEELLKNCLVNSLIQDQGAATHVALKYCDLANRDGKLQDWINTLPYFDGYNFEYIYENKF